MAKWRPVDIRVWSDRKFLALNDDGRQLWLYFLTCPFMTIIPGVIVSGEMAIAETLGWTTKRYREGYRELLAKGLSVKSEGRLIWLSRTFAYQKINGPKHIEAMRRAWDDIPDGELKVELWEALKIACHSWDKLFAKGFPKPHAIPHTKGLDTVTTSGSVTVTASGTGDCASRKAHRLPDGWTPSRSDPNAEAEAEARSRGVDLKLELSKLHDWARDKGATGKDWDARWRNWIRQARGTTRNSSNGQSVFELQLERVRMLEAEERAEKGEL